MLDTENTLPMHGTSRSVLSELAKDPPIFPIITGTSATGGEAILPDLANVVMTYATPSV